MTYLAFSTSMLLLFGVPALMDFWREFKNAPPAPRDDAKRRITFGGVSAGLVIAGLAMIGLDGSPRWLGYVLLGVGGLIGLAAL